MKRSVDGDASASVGASEWPNWAQGALEHLHALETSPDNTAATTPSENSDLAAQGTITALAQDDASVEFARHLFDAMVGTDDAFAAALELKDVASDIPESLPRKDRLALQASGLLSLGLPWVVLPLARRWLRGRIGPLLVVTPVPGDESAAPRSSRKLVAAIDAATSPDHSPVVQLLGSAVHGRAAAAAEAQRLAAAAAHSAASRLVIDPARLVPASPLTDPDWSSEGDIERARDAIAPILREFSTEDAGFVLDARDPHWARLAPNLLEQLLADPARDQITGGVWLPADLPESRELYAAIARQAARRVREGGVPLEITLGLSHRAEVERVRSVHSGLAVPFIEDPIERTAQFLRLIELAVHPGRAAHLRPIVASDDPVILAAAHATESTDLSMQTQRGLRTSAPPSIEGAGNQRGCRELVSVVDPDELAAALPLLMRVLVRSAERSAPDVARQDEARLRAALELAANQPAPSSHRTQRRSREWHPSERDSALFYRPPDEPAAFDTGGLTAAVLGLNRGSTGAIELEPTLPPRSIPVVSASGFANEPPTDASVPENRTWARGLLEQVRSDTRTRPGEHDTVALSDADRDAVATAHGAREGAREWNARSHGERAMILRHLALATVAARDRLVRALAAETGAPIGELDAMVGEIADAIRYDAKLAESLGRVRGATFQPEQLALVTASPEVGIATQAEAVVSALASGSAVLWSVPRRLGGTVHALVEEWLAAGLPTGTVTIETIALDATLGELAATPRIDRAVVLGRRADARALVRRRPELRIEGSFLGCGSVVVTPSADLNLAVDGLALSALRGAGADPDAAHVAILLGSVARSKRLRDGLIDALRSVRVGDTGGAEIGASVDPLELNLGPLAMPPSPAQLRALTELHRGETWLVEPQQLDEEGRLWSPGLRAGVAPTSTFWDDAVGVPVLGLASAHTMSEAVALQNRRGGGNAAGLYAEDADEVMLWLDRAQAARLSLNRATVEGASERRPWGAWGVGSMGLPALAGASSRLVPMGSWTLREGSRSDTLHLRGLDPDVRHLIEAVQPSISYEEFDEVRRAALSDALTWRTEFGVARDVVGLGFERNALRHRPVFVHVRLAEAGSLAALVRVLVASLAARAPISVSVGSVLPNAVSRVLGNLGVDVSLERDRDWLERLAVSAGAAADGSDTAERIRLIDGDPVRTAEWLGGLDRVALWAEPVTMAGSVELLVFVREQAVSALAERHGFAVPVPGLDELLS